MNWDIAIIITVSFLLVMIPAYIHECHTERIIHEAKKAERKEIERRLAR